METEPEGNILSFGRIRDLDISQWPLPLKALGIECQKQYVTPPVIGKEPKETDLDIQRLAVAIVHSIKTLYEDASSNPDVYTILDEFIHAIPPGMPASRVFNGVRIFANLKNMHLRDYPSQRSSFWKDFLNFTLNDNERRREFLEFIGETHNSTNIPQRFIGAQFAITTHHREQMAHPYRVLVPGASLGNDLLTAIYNVPLVPLDIFSDERRTSRDEPTEAKLNRLLQNRFARFIGVGVDLIDIQNERDVAIANAGRYPWELRKIPFDVREAELAQLNERRRAAVESGSLRFIVGDFCKLETLVEPDDPLIQPGEFDATLFSTMLNQLTLDQQIQAMEVAKKYTKEGGLVIVQDFARPKPGADATEVGSIEELNVIPPTAVDFTYGLWAEVMGGDGKLRKLLSFRSGRALQAVLTPYGKERLEYANSGV